MQSKKKHKLINLNILL